MDIREIPLKLLMFFGNFLGTGMVMAFFRCAGASSWFKTMLEYLLKVFNKLVSPVF